MIVSVDRHQTTSARARPDHGHHVTICAGLLAGMVFGTGTGVSNLTIGDAGSMVTTAPGGWVVTAGFGVSQEVRELRDRISEMGLTRRHIARAVGVDRRSLSGWASGELRPLEERLTLLRQLADLVADIDAARPGRAREVLTAPREGPSLLDRFAAEAASIRSAWRATAGRGAIVTYERRDVGRDETVWEAAARALAEGRLGAPAAGRTVRPPEDDEMDPAEAAPYREPDVRRGRRGYR